MLKIAITGNIGSGKSTVVHLFKLLGIPVFSADVAGHKALLRPEVTTALHALFGDVVFDENGTPNRKKIGEIVFSDSNKRQQLNDLVHPVIKDEILQWFDRQPPQTPYALCEVALLFETGFETSFDKIITVSAHEMLRIKRIETRDGITKQAIIQRMASQMDEKMKISRSDYHIINDGVRSVVEQVLEIHGKSTGV